MSYQLESYIKLTLDGILVAVYINKWPEFAGLGFKPVELCSKQEIENCLTPDEIREAWTEVNRQLNARWN